MATNVHFYCLVSVVLCRTRLNVGDETLLVFLKCFNSVCFRFCFFNGTHLVQNASFHVHTLCFKNQMHILCTIKVGCVYVNTDPFKVCEHSLT